MNRRLLRLWPLALGLSLAVAAAFLIVGQWRGADLREAAASVDWRVVPLALGLHVLAHVFWGLRVSTLGRTAPLASWRLVTAGTFGGAVTPGRIGGEGVKLGLLVRGGMPGAKATQLLLADRALDLIFFILMGLVALLALPAIYGGLGTEAAFFAGLGTATLAGFTLFVGLSLAAPKATGRIVHGLAVAGARVVRKPAPVLEAKAEEFVRSVRQGFLALLGAAPWRLVLAVGLTLANWMAEYAALWVLLRGFGIELAYPAVFLVGIIVTLISNIPITPGGTGVAEATALALLGPIGAGPLLVVLWRAVAYQYDLMVGGAVAVHAWRKPSWF